MIWKIFVRLKKRAAGLVKRLRDYAFYRNLGQGVGESWDNAGRTL